MFLAGLLPDGYIRREVIEGSNPAVALVGACLLPRRFSIGRGWGYSGRGITCSPNTPSAASVLVIVEVDIPVHPGNVWIDKGFLAKEEDRCQVVCAKAGVCTDSAIVENRDLLTNVRVAPVRHAVRLLLAGEADARVGSIAERLDGRAAAPAEGH